MINGRFGKFSGQAKITFLTWEDSEKAFEAKNFEFLGNRYIELFKNEGS